MGLITKLTEFFTLAIHGSPKNQDYIMSKGMHKWVVAFLSPSKKEFANNLNFLKTSCFLLGVMPTLSKSFAWPIH